MYEPSEALRKAVEDNDLSGIKTCLVNIINFDQTFQTNDFEKACEFVAGKGIELYQEHSENATEIRIVNKSEWTPQYFFHLVENLRLNFAPDDRIKHIEEVGKFVFEKDMKINNSKLSEDSFPVLTQKTQSSSGNSKVAVAAVVIGLVGLSIIALYCMKN